MKTIRNLFADKKGATAIEYGLIAALIAVAAITAMSSLGTNLQHRQLEADHPVGRRKHWWQHRWQHQHRRLSPGSIDKGGRQQCRPFFCALNT